MTTTPAEKTVQPRLNTTTNWSLPRDAASCPSEQEGELSPLSPGRATEEYGREHGNEGHGHGNAADERRREKGSEGLVMEALVSRPRDSLGKMSSDMVEEVRREVRKMFKEELAQAAQVTQTRNSETAAPIDTSHFSPLSSRNPVFTPSCSSPPPSVIEAPSASNVSSPRDQSPEVTHAMMAPAPLYHPPAPAPVSTPAPQSTPPTSPRQITARSWVSVPPVTHCQLRVDSASELASPSAPAATPRVEFNSVDSAWGVLFDSKGYSTQRLNSVLRGLANFTIAEVEPPESLVVTPDKMLTLYTRYKIEPERLRYEDIFRPRSEDALRRIEFLYQDLDCQYHLVQAAPRSHPDVPGLTPVGFAKWMTSNILAYPGPEARRLHAFVSALPVDADGPLRGKPERLPRPLSRHLLPGSHDEKVRRTLDEAVWDCLEDAAPPLPAIPRAGPGPPQDASGSLPGHRDLPPPPLGRHSAPQRRHSPAPTNRYSSSSPTISHHRDGSPLSPPAQLAPPSAFDTGRGGADADADRGPTWEEVYSRRGSLGGRVPSVGVGSHRSFR